MENEKRCDSVDRTGRLRCELPKDHPLQHEAKGDNAYTTSWLTPVPEPTNYDENTSYAAAMRALTRYENNVEGNETLVEAQVWSLLAIADELRALREALEPLLHPPMQKMPDGRRWPIYGTFGPIDSRPDLANTVLHDAP